MVLPVLGARAQLTQRSDSVKIVQHRISLTLTTKAALHVLLGLRRTRHAQRVWTVWAQRILHSEWPAALALHQVW